MQAFPRTLWQRAALIALSTACSSQDAPSPAERATSMAPPQGSVSAPTPLGGYWTGCLRTTAGDVLLLTCPERRTVSRMTEPQFTSADVDKTAQAFFRPIVPDVTPQKGTLTLAEGVVAETRQFAGDVPDRRGGTRPIGVVYAALFQGPDALVYTCAGPKLEQCLQDIRELHAHPDP